MDCHEKKKIKILEAGNDIILASNRDLKAKRYSVTNEEDDTWYIYHNIVCLLG